MIIRDLTREEALRIEKYGLFFYSVNNRASFRKVYKYFAGKDLERGAIGFFVMQDESRERLFSDGKRFGDFDSVFHAVTIAGGGSCRFVACRRGDKWKAVAKPHFLNIKK